MTITYTDYTQKVALLGTPNGTFSTENVSDIAPPPGLVVMWIPTTSNPGPPKGWKFCNGSTYKIYGSNFISPDTQGRIPLGWNPGTSLRNTGGEKTHALTLEESAHFHNIDIYKRSSGTCDYGSAGTYRTVLTAENLNKLSGFTSTQGGGQSHNNLPPYQVVRFIIKVDE